MKNLLFTIIVIICFIFMEEVNAQCTGVEVGDSLALVALYESCGGVSWTYDDEDYHNGISYSPTPNLGNTWLLGAISTWHGIVLTADGCNIKKIIFE